MFELVATEVVEDILKEGGLRKGPIIVVIANAPHTAVHRHSWPYRAVR